MLPLQTSLKKTVSLAEGYQLGWLYFEGDAPMISTAKGELKVEDKQLEVLNGGQWMPMSPEYYARRTKEGYPLFGGFDCRWK